MKKGKKYSDSLKLIDRTKLYDPEEAVALVKQTAKAKFDETVEISVRLGVDPAPCRSARSAAPWCCPTAPARPCACSCSPRATRPNEALAAGADFVGAEDMVAKIQGGWFDFDVCVATPDMMGMVGPSGPRARPPRA